MIHAQDDEVDKSTLNLRLLKMVSELCYGTIAYGIKMLVQRF